MPKTARRAYLSIVSHQQSPFGFSGTAQIPNFNENDVRKLNNTFAVIAHFSTKCVPFVPLDVASFFMAIFQLASFAINPHLSSQLGYLITLMEKHQEKHNSLRQLQSKTHNQKRPCVRPLCTASRFWQRIHSSPCGKRHSRESKPSTHLHRLTQSLWMND